MFALQSFVDLPSRSEGKAQHTKNVLQNNLILNVVLYCIVYSVSYGVGSWVPAIWMALFLALEESDGARLLIRKSEINIRALCVPQKSLTRLSKNLSINMGKWHEMTTKQWEQVVNSQQLQKWSKHHSAVHVQQKRPKKGLTFAVRPKKDKALLSEEPAKERRRKASWRAKARLHVGFLHPRRRRPRPSGFLLWVAGCLVWEVDVVGTLLQRRAECNAQSPRQDHPKMKHQYKVMPKPKNRYGLLMLLVMWLQHSTITL